MTTSRDFFARDPGLGLCKKVVVVGSMVSAVLGSIVAGESAPSLARQNISDVVPAEMYRMAKVPLVNGKILWIGWSRLWDFLSQGWLHDC